MCFDQTIGFLVKVGQSFFKLDQPFFFAMKLWVGSNITRKEAYLKLIDITINSVVLKD